MQKQPPAIPIPSFRLRKVFHQGLLLVALPLSVCIAVVLVSLAQSAHLDKAYQQESHTRQILVQTSDLSSLFLQGANHLLQFYATKSKDKLELLHKLVDEIDERNRKLAELVEGYPTEKAAYGPIKADIEEGKRDILKILEIMKSPLTVESGLQAMEARQKTEAAIYRGIRHFDALLELARRKQSEQLAAGASLRAGERMFDLSALGFVVVLAVVLVRHFAQAIEARLAIMVDNTKRLQNQQELQERVFGSDEIAELDASFHYMSEALAEAKKREQEMEEMKRQFYAMITHDIRTPLMALETSLTLTLETSSDRIPNDVAVTLKRASSSTTRLTELISNLLDLEKFAAGKFDLFFRNEELAEIIEISTVAVEPLADKNNIEIVVSGENMDVYCDRERMVQVLVNLMSNALKYSPPGASVEIKQVRLAGWLEIQIIDQGPGIPADVQARLFQTYVQGADVKARQGKSTGLGLAICKLIVEQHDGQIGVTSEPGKGSTFWIRLPAI